MDINTAYRGTPHVTAENSADLNRGVVGAESYVLPVGMQFEAELVTNNLIKIRDGCGCMQGRQVSIKKGLSDEITVENGTQGEKRIDIIAIRYEKDINTEIESVETILIKGTPSEDGATVPEHTHGDIRAGDATVDWPIYEVELDGISVVGVRPLFNLLYNAAEIKQKIDSLNSKLNGVLTLRSGVNNASSTDTSYVYKRGHKACLFLDITATFSGENNIYATLPVGFRPSRIIRFSGTAGTSYWNAIHVVSFMLYPDTGYVTGVCSSATSGTKYARGYIEFDID